LPQKNTAIIIHSPHSGKSAQLPEALKLLKQADIAIAEVLPITQLSASPIGSSLRKELGINLVIAAGGDGLIGGVITHIAESSLPLGILPLGTANDLARSINIPQDLQQAVDTIKQGRITEIDIGTAKPAGGIFNQRSRQGSTKQTFASPRSYGCFAHALTVGLNVQFARRATNAATRQRYGKLTYPMAAFKAWLSHEPLEFDIRIEGLSLPPQADNSTLEKQEEPTIVEESVAFHGRALQVAVINASTFGGKWSRTLPNISINDHLLDIIIIEAIELQSLIAAFENLFNTEAPSETSGQTRYTQQSLLEAAYLSGIPGIRHIQARCATISTDNDPEDVTLDGEIRGQTPIHVQMANTPLQVIVP
jgi:diacylglycerol kinase family enzyme